MVGIEYYVKSNYPFYFKPFVPHCCTEHVGNHYVPTTVRLISIVANKKKRSTTMGR